MERSPHFAPKMLSKKTMSLKNSPLVKGMSWCNIHLAGYIEKRKCDKIWLRKMEARSKFSAQKGWDVNDRGFKLTAEREMIKNISYGAPWRASNWPVRSSKKSYSDLLSSFKTNNLISDHWAKTCKDETHIEPEGKSQ